MPTWIFIALVIGAPGIVGAVIDYRRDRPGFPVVTGAMLVLGGITAVSALWDYASTLQSPTRPQVVAYALTHGDDVVRLTSYSEPVFYRHGRRKAPPQMHYYLDHVLRDDRFGVASPNDLATTNGACRRATIAGHATSVCYTRSVADSELLKL